MKYLAFFILLLSFSYHQKQREINPISVEDGSDTNPAFIKRLYGRDSIPTGVPIQIKGVHQSGDSFPEPEPVKILSRPKVVPAYTNEIPWNKEPNVVQVPKPSQAFTPGENGIPLPKDTILNFTVTPVQHPQPVPALPPSMRNNAKFDIQYLDTKHGLLSNQINDILQDKNQNLWFATNSGLSRYDGKYFTHYTKKEGLIGSRILKIFEDSKGNLWLDVHKTGVSRFDGHNFSHFDIKVSSASTKFNISPFQEDQNGHIWIISGGEWFKFIEDKNKHEAQFIQYFNTPKGFIGSEPCLIDKKGNFWISTFNFGVIRFDGKTFTRLTQEDGLSSNYLPIFMEDSKGRIWISNLAGVDIFQYGEGEKPPTIRQYKLGGSIGNMLEDDNGDIWYSSDDPQFGKGVLELNEAGDIQNIIKFSPENGLSGTGSYALEKDSSGYIWIGTSGGGVNRIDLRSFKNYTTDDGLGSNAVSSIAADVNGHLWFGNETLYHPAYVASKFDGNNFNHFTLQEGLQNPYVRYIYKDSRGHLWFVHQRGVTRYDHHSFFHYPPEVFNHPGGLWTAYEDSKGSLWILGTQVFRLGLDKNGKVLDYVSYPRSKYVYAVSDMVEDKHKTLWFSTWGNGVFRLKEADNWVEGEVTFFTENEGLISNSVQTIFSDSAGNLWFATNGGLSFLSEKQLKSNDPKFIHFSMKNGLKSNLVSSIIEDDDKNIWISTENEIALFKYLKEGESVEMDPIIPNYKFYSFNHLDGLHQKSYFPRSVLKEGQNQLWWGTEDGATKLDLTKFGIPSEPPQNIHLLNLEINQQHISFGKLKDTTYQNSLEIGSILSQSFDSVARYHNYPINLTLPYNINHLTFHFSAIDWGAPHNIKYSYMIDGLDNDWSPIQHDPKADYRGLPPGKHTLNVKAIGEGQAWGKPFEYTFTILPPWWQTIWAYIGYALIIGAIAYFLYQYLLNQRLSKEEAKRLKELDTIKTKLYTNISHEFRTPLTVISGMSDKIKENPRKWAMEGTNLITRNSKHLLKLVNQILDLRKLESGTLKVNFIQADIVAYVQYLLQSFQSLAGDKNIQVHFYAEEKELIMDFDPDKMQHIISNLVSNAIKFTPKGGNVYVSVQRSGFSVLSNGHSNNKGQFLSIKVRDTGIGIEEEKLAHIFDRFYQVDDSSTRQGEGTGIGLALTKELVQLLNGDISVKSEASSNSENTGTEFTILLPISNDALLEENTVSSKVSSNSATIPISPSPTVSGAMVSSSKPLALIIEDNADVAKYLFTCLEDDYQLLWSKNGQEGIDKAIEATPDIIISDVMMPQKNGFEVCQELKQNLRTSHIPIILLTAKADLDSKLEGLSHGADAYLSKPFSQKELNIRLQKLIELRLQLQNHYSQYNLSKGKSKNLEEEFLIKLQEQIFQNLADEDFGVLQLSRKMAMSRSQLFRKIKSLTNKSTSSYIRTLRLSKARELLNTTDLHISEIAYEVGFSNPIYFTQAFSEEFGVPPSEIRE